jgi:hypothetical protein
VRGWAAHGGPGTPAVRGRGRCGSLAATSPTARCVHMRCPHRRADDRTGQERVAPRPQALDLAAARRPLGRIGRRGLFPRDGAAGAKKTAVIPWHEKMWCLPPTAEAEFVARMEDRLEWSQLPSDPLCPVVCMEALCKPWSAEARVPLPGRAGYPARYD